MSVEESMLDYKHLCYDLEASVVHTRQEVYNTQGNRLGEVGGKKVEKESSFPAEN